MLEEVKQFVDESFKNSSHPNTPDHLERTLGWLLKLKPDADEAMQISAYAHDIARAFSSADFEDRPFDDREYLNIHQKTGAEIISKFLAENGYNEEIIKRVYNMIARHEDGGDVESDLIKDSDSLSYLERPAHIKPQFIEKLGKNKVKYKLDYMYNRISSEKAKELAKPYYTKALKMLESY